MLLVREVMFCKPGKVRALVEKFKEMSDLMVKNGMKPMRVLTDFSAERYWMLTAEMEVNSLGDFERMMQGEGMAVRDLKKMDSIMKDYHDLVESGRREIYKIE